MAHHGQAPVSHKAFLNCYFSIFNWFGEKSVVFSRLPNHTIGQMKELTFTLPAIECSRNIAMDHFAVLSAWIVFWLVFEAS